MESEDLKTQQVEQKPGGILKAILSFFKPKAEPPRPEEPPAQPEELVDSKVKLQEETPQTKAA